MNLCPTGFALRCFFRVAVIYVDLLHGVGFRVCKMAAMALGEDVASASRLLVLLMSYAFAPRLGIHNTDCKSHLVRSIDPYNIWLY